MKVVYLAGPYGDAGGYDVIDKNIDKARQWAIELACNGIPYFCPHLNSAHFEKYAPDVPVWFWRDVDMEMLKRCDALVVVPEYELSVGTCFEILAAQTSLNKPVFFMPKDWESLDRWYRGQ